MTRKELLDLANECYPDGFLHEYYDSEGNVVQASGDTLAQFIVIELIETYDASAETYGVLDEAIRCLGVAAHDLDGVIDRLRAKRFELAEAGKA